jgi:hypothetical protein
MGSAGKSRRPLTRGATVLLVGALAVLVLVLEGCGASKAKAGGATTTTHAASAVQVPDPSGKPGSGTIRVTGDAVGNPLPQGFVGMSIEEKALEQFAGANPKAIDPVFLHLLQDISPNQSPVLRIGGDSTDWSWWPVPGVAQPPGVKFGLTPTWMSVAQAVAEDLHAKLILGVDLEADSQVVATAEARAMMSRIGRQYIDALELGNEPELYGTFGWYRSKVTGQQVPGRPRSYDIADYMADFNRFSAYLSGDPLAGPSMGAPEWLESLGTYVNDEKRLSVVTVHAYPLKHCSKSTVVTNAELLADSSSHGLAQRVAPWVALSARHHLPLRIDEMNAISCGGTRGVSDAFGSALWMLDTLFEMARTGVAGVNVHTVPNTINEVLGPQFANGHWSIRVHPEYYGMVMFAQAAPAGSHLLRISSPLPAGVKVWATRATDGTIHAVVINKRLAGTETVHLNIASAQGTASVEQLRAPSLSATSGVTLGGQTFGAATSTGLLGGNPANLTISPAAGAYTVVVPAASATMLTIPAS